MMKKILMMASAAAALVLSASCGREERALYPGGEYIMFADSTAMYYMTDDPDDSFPVEVASTVACDYDRTYAIEFLAGESNAIEGVNFTIDSYNVEIPAGEMTGTVHLKGVFDSIEASDSIGVVLRLLVPEDKRWPGDDQTMKISFAKTCDHDLDTFVEDGGNFVLYASFPFSSYQVVRKLVKATKIDDNRLEFEDLLDVNMPIKMRFNLGDYTNPYVEVLPQTGFYTQDYGDATVETDPLYGSYFYPCQKLIIFYLKCYSQKIGTFGTYFYALEWVSQEMADYYEKNGFE